MAEPDTIRLLRECDAGVKMGTEAMNEVLEDIRNPRFRECLTECRDRHEELGKEIRELLSEYGDDGKDPNFIAQGMSWLKTNVMLAIKDSDQTIADLLTDGCGMGVKSLSRYLNQYGAAAMKARNIAGKLIRLEEKLAADIRPYL